MGDSGVGIGVSVDVGVPVLIQLCVSFGDGAGVSLAFVTSDTVDSESRQDTRTNNKPKIIRIFNVSPLGD